MATAMHALIRSGCLANLWGEELAVHVSGLMEPIVQAAIGTNLQTSPLSPDAAPHLARPSTVDVADKHGPLPLLATLTASPGP